MTARYTVLVVFAQQSWILWKPRCAREAHFGILCSLLQDTRQDGDGGTWQTNACCCSQLLHQGQLNPAHLNRVTCLSSIIPIWVHINFTRNSDVRPKNQNFRRKVRNFTKQNSEFSPRNLFFAENSESWSTNPNIHRENPNFHRGVGANWFDIRLRYLSPEI